MAAAPISIVAKKPEVPKSSEPNPSQPLSETDKCKALLDKYGKKLIDLHISKAGLWEWKRRAVVFTVFTNKEMYKGNQNVAVGPGTFNTIDAITDYETWNGSPDAKNGDRTMDQRCHNFYQMLCKAFVAALCAQLPKTRSIPANADVEEDRETAKVASRIQAIIERANKAQGMMMHQLMELFTGGCYFRFTRYVVDETRTGTHKETVLQVNKAEVLPARYTCFNCGTTTPEDELVAQQSLTCPHCGAPLGPQNYFEDHVEQVPIAEQKEDVPNGMVLQNVYGALNVNVDPDAADLRTCGMLNVAEEVALGWLRTTFDDKWDQFQEGQTSSGSSESIERLYRDLLTTPGGNGLGQFGTFTNQTKPTYNRTWFQPIIFAEIGTKEEGQELQKNFPDGCMLAWTGDMPLQIRKAKLTDEWTWCGTDQKGYGMYPQPVGNPAVPVQQRINDCVNRMDEYFDRLAFGILLGLEEYVDTKQLNGKALLPGVVNPVWARKGQQATISEMIFQVKTEMDAQMMPYLSMLKQDMELLVGTPPQTFGAGTQDGVETMGGQKQQLDTGLMKMGLAWKFVCEEAAEAAENAIKCAALNMTEDWMDVVSDETEEFRNEYVHLDQMKGSVHVESDTDQGIPMSYSDQRNFWLDVAQNPTNQLSTMLLSVPENVEAMIRFVGPAGIVAPAGAMRGKLLQILNQLVQGQAIQQPDPVTGQPIMVPSMMPNKYLDDLQAMTELIPRWAADHWDKIKDNQQIMDNLDAYMKTCYVYMKEVQAEKQLAGPPPVQQGQGQPQGAQA